MSQSTFRSDVHVIGNFSCTTMTVPDATVDDDAVKPAAGIQATKLQHQHAIKYHQADGSDVAAAIVPIHVVRGVSATIVAVEVVCLDAPDGGDKTFTVDLQKCNEGSPSPASVLSAAISYSVGSTHDAEVHDGTISSPTLADGDTLVVEVAVSGSTGTQGQGLVVTVTLREDAE